MGREARREEGRRQGGPFACCVPWHQHWCLACFLSCVPQLHRSLSHSHAWPPTCLLRHPSPPLSQIPAGLLADRIGGAHLAAAGLFAWSAACLLFARVPAAANPLAALLVARAALGLAQSCLMPAASALAGGRETLGELASSLGAFVLRSAASCCTYQGTCILPAQPTYWLHTLCSLPSVQPAGSLPPPAAGRPAPFTRLTLWAR